MGKIRDLVLGTTGKVYIHLSDAEIGNRFMRDAEAEGFRFGDGVRPTEREWSDLIAVFPDMTLCYVGFVGHMAYGCSPQASHPPLVKVDYGEFIRSESGG